MNNSLDRPSYLAAIDRLTSHSSAFNRLASQVTQPSYLAAIDRLTSHNSAFDRLASQVTQPSYLAAIDRLTSHNSAFDRLASQVTQPSYLAAIDRLTSHNSAFDRLASQVTQPSYLAAFNTATGIAAKSMLDRLYGNPSAFDTATGIAAKSALDRLYGNPSAFDTATGIAAKSALDRLYGNPSAFDTATGIAAKSALGSLYGNPSILDSVGRVNALITATKSSYLDALTTVEPNLVTLRSSYLHHFSSTETPYQHREHAGSADLFAEVAPGHSPANSLERVALNAFVELRTIETEVRAVISFAMSATFGDDWFVSRVPARLLNKWMRYRETALANGEADAPLLYFADFSDYGEVLAYNDNWTTVFCTVFSSRDDVIGALRRLNTLRRPTMHSRNISKELMRVLEVEIAQLRRSMERIAH